MTGKTSIWSGLESLIDRIGEQVTRAVADQLARSDLPRKIEDLVRRNGTWPADDDLPGKLRGRPKKTPKTCSVQDCREPARARGMCSKHYQRDRYQRTGNRKKNRPD